MRKEFLKKVQADVSRLEELLHKFEGIHEKAVDDLDALEIADAEGDGTEPTYLLAISNGIRQAMDECIKFDAHFWKKYGGGRGMRRDSVSLLIDMARTAMEAVNSIRMAAGALEDNGDVMELITDSLDEAYTGLETAEDELHEYLATKAED